MSWGSLTRQCGGGGRATSHRDSSVSNRPWRPSRCHAPEQTGLLAQQMELMMRNKRDHFTVVLQEATKRGLEVWMMGPRDLHGVRFGQPFFLEVLRWIGKKAFEVSYRKRHIKKPSIKSERNDNHPSSAEDPHKGWVLFLILWTLGILINDQWHTGHQTPDVKLLMTTLFIIYYHYFYRQH